MQPQRLGKYEITGKLGKGAMGEVFRAHDPVLGRDVAIKILRAARTDEEAGERFLREARAAAQLNHPNIITVHDFGEEYGLAYMAMELLEGHDLRELIEKEQTGTLEDRLALMEQILDGVAFAHAQGVVHRDLKPGNVSLLPSGQVKILDFGLALRAVDTGSSGSIRGTPYYMSPEQVTGERATTRSDVFSLGAMFYEVLTGRRPFPGSTIPDVLYSVVNDEPAPLPGDEIPAVVAAVIARALEKDPAARFADAGAMHEALHAAWDPTVDAEPMPAGLDAPEVSLGPSLASRPDVTAELKVALSEVTQYLDDHVPPLFAAESVVWLSRRPPLDAAIHVLEWAREQRPSAPDVPLAELLFHALHKLSMVGTLNLTEKAPLVARLRAAGERLVDACASGDRDAFRTALTRLGESDAMDSAFMRRKQTVADAPRTATATPGLRRLSLLEQRLRRDRRAGGPGAEAARRRVASQALILAANEASSAAELALNLKRLRAVGVPSGAGEVFRSLGQELPEWALPGTAVAAAAVAPPPREVRAMQQIISLAEDPVEAGARFRHLVTAATQLFNEGNLGRAVRMLQLAGRLVAERKVQPAFTDPVVRRGHERLDQQRLRSYMDKPERHPQLQAVMSFFDAGLGVETLLQQLETEERRDRRRMLLALLVVHGERARATALARLVDSLQAPASDFARRNWVYLLRVVPRPAAERPEAEVDALARFSAPGNPPFLVKESLLCLAQTRHPRATQALAAVLEAWEAEAEHSKEGSPERAEAHDTLDKVAAALARQGPAAWPVLLDHGLSRRRELGETVARLAELGTQDLSAAHDVVEAICADLRDGHPRGVLGRLVGRTAVDLPWLVAALGSTRTPAVKAVLDETVRRCSGQEAGRAAARVLEAAAAPLATPAVLSGELDPYGLPAILHRLDAARSAGTLQLLPADGGVPASIGIAPGRLLAARYGPLQGMDAFHQLFERPFEGTYALEPQGVPGDETLGEVAALVTEGLERRAEFQRVLAVVPEDGSLEPTGEPPGTVAEGDYELVVAIWERACAGTTAGAMEAQLPVEALRIYGPLAQWLEEGALRPAPSTEPPPPDDDTDEDVSVISPGS